MKRFRGDVLWLGLVAITVGMAFSGVFKRTTVHQPVTSSWDVATTRFRWRVQPPGGARFLSYTFDAFGVDGSRPGCTWRVELQSEDGKTQTSIGYWTADQFRTFLNGLTQHGIWDVTDRRLHRQ